MKSPIIEKAERKLADAERVLEQERADEAARVKASERARPWRVRWAEDQVTAAKKRIQHFQYVQFEADLEIEIAQRKYAKDRGLEYPSMQPPKPPELPVPEISDEEWVANYKPDPALVKETVKEVMADIKALCAPPPPEPPPITDDPSGDDPPPT